MVDYSKYITNARQRHIPTRDVYVQLPPTKTDCTCITLENPELSIMNGPSVYCETCGNKGYIETKVEQKVTGPLVDFVGDTLNSHIALNEDLASFFDNQKYVFHSALSDCTAEDYDDQYCFDLAKEVRVGEDYYKILGLDKSTLLNQIKVVIALKN